MADNQKIWRFLDYQACDGAWNMAVDEAILEAHIAGEVPPTLRLYGFVPPAISIGANQRVSAQLLAGAAEHGFDVVRRPTGGRAVLHLNELTYSFVGSDNLSSSVVGAYKQICLGLQNAFVLLGVQVELGSSSSAYKQFEDCFLATTTCDLHYKGTKIAGSAQLRRKQAVLQHGTIALNQDQAIMPRVLGATSGSEQQRHANLFEIIGQEVDFKELSRVMRQGFEQAFAVSFTSSSLSKSELAAANRLKEKYLLLN